MYRLRLTLISLLLATLFTEGLAAIYYVRDFGAKGDGQHIDSPAINAALLKAANDGEGAVVLTEGTYLC